MDIFQDAIRSRIDMSLKVIRMYDWLLDQYVVDYFVENHWDKLPSSWKANFQDLDPQKLGSILSEKPTNHMFPLSFLALLQTVKVLSIPRHCDADIQPELQTDDAGKCGSHPRLQNLFLKHVKLKKRHEISRMARVVSDTAGTSGCDAVIDFGAGVGHLVRMLAYKYDLHAAGIECQTQLTEEARKLDYELEYTAGKHLSPATLSNLHRPTHLNFTLSSHEQLLELPLPKTMTNYGLVGLHPCGDLGPLLLKHFVMNERVKFICLVSCCHMKLTSSGYPLSEYVKGLDNSKLSFASREVSCHNIEVYAERLLRGQYEDLKIHAYRAALENILVDISPKLKHSKVRSIKHSDGMTFERYCSLALDKVDSALPADRAARARAAAQTAQWRRVVTAFTLRLALAPLVETAVLWDRVLFVAERGMSCEIRPVFDPKLSPRNHLIIARR